MFTIPPFLVSMIVKWLVNRNDGDKEFLALNGIMYLSVLMAGNFMMFYLPRYSTTIVLVSRFIIGVSVCYINFVRFQGN